MILADKIILLRKKNGWSQEQLAEQLNISRQSVSKWESGASIPDLDKIIKMSDFFGVSTDYLLKDELEEIEFGDSKDVPFEKDGKSVSLEEANTYMDLVEKAAKSFAFATMLCVLSPVCMILLAGLAEAKLIGLTEDMAGGFGLAILLLFVTIGVVVFIWQGMKLSRYDYLEKEFISLQYGVQGVVEKRRADFDRTYRGCIVLGTALCILAVVPLGIAAGFEMAEVVFVCFAALLLVIVSIAVLFFVWAAMIHGSYEKLLEEGEYTREKKEVNRKISFLPGVYWCITLAFYFLISMPDNSWGSPKSWIVWPVAAVLYAAVQGILGAVLKDKKQK